MIDFPNQTGKMCHWSNVEAVTGAYDTLSSLSKRSKIYIATNAADSTVSDIQLAFERVELAEFISGYFCRFNLGLPKGSKAFYLKIAKQLSVEPANLIMVGDSLDKDIELAIDAGLQAIWFNQNSQNLSLPNGCQHIKSLTELCELI